MCARHVLRDPRPADLLDRLLSVPLYPHCVTCCPVLAVIPRAQAPASLVALLPSRSLDGFALPDWLPVSVHAVGSSIFDLPRM